MRILKSSEDYLEAMLVMSERHGYIVPLILPQNWA